jgi:hypothetical protein
MALADMTASAPEVASNLINNLDMVFLPEWLLQRWTQGANSASLVQVHALSDD